MSQQFPKMSFEGGRILRHLASDPQSAPPAPTPFSPSLTYELYYGLKEKPFSLSADPRFLYRTPTHGPAYEELLNGIRRREGLIVLTGEIGTGKTTLIRSVLEHLDRRTFSAFVPDPFASREDLLKMLLVDFGVVSIADLKRGSLNGASRPDLSYPLYEFLDSLVPLQAFAVMIVDEAQNLPLPLLEEIRILSDLEGREKLLQVVLVGQPELRDHLKLPEMRQVDQRVSVRCELRPLALDDIAGYVRHRLNVAGDGDSRVEFSDGAIEAVHRGSGGTPRLINKICDRALARGYTARVSRIDADFVSAAIRDLGLELPSTTEPQSVQRGLQSTRQPGSGLQSARTIDEGLRPSPELQRTGQSTRQRDDELALQQERPHDGESARQGAIEVRVVDPDVTPQILSEFAAESELPRSVRVEAPAPASWTLAATSAIAAALALGITLVFLYLRSQAGEVSVVALPSPPPRAPLPTLTVPSLPNAWIMPVVAAPKRTSAAADAADRFAIQVASFSTQARADSVIEELAQSGFSARTVTLDFGPARGQLVQVLLGGYGSADDAQNDFTRVREQFPDARIVGR